MELYKRIKSLRLEHRMTQKELGEKLDVSTVSIGHWEAGTKKPSVSAIISMTRIFRVSADYLLGITDEDESGVSLFTRGEQSLLYNYRLLDKYGRKAVDAICAIEKARTESERALIKKADIIPMHNAGRYIPRYIIPSAAGTSAPLDGGDFTMILVDNDIPSDADFAVRIQGNSMRPYIYDGDTVYVKRDCELSIGDVGIFCVDGAMYCKQYYIDEEGNLSLVSANPDLRDTNIYISSDSGMSVMCYGKVLLDFRTELPEYMFSD